MTKLPMRSYVVVALLAAVVSLIVGLATTTLSTRGVTEGGQANQVYHRVLKTGTIRCGYVTYPPGCIKDPNTGKLSGIFVEALERAAGNMDLKVEWVEEVGWGSMIEGLRSDRYDLIGSQVWANSSRAKLADFTVPLFYSGIGIYVRSDDTRFDGDQSKINSPDVKIATIDGEMSDIIARQQFPQATQVSLPQLSDNAQLLLNITEGKADVTFVEPYIAQLFLKTHPGSLRNLASDRPIRIFPNTMMLKKGEVELKAMLDTALTELINSGHINDLLRKHTAEPGAFYPVAYPYRVDFPAEK